MLLNKGKMFLVLSIICGCLNDVMSKYLGQSVSSGEIVFFRSFFGMLILIPFMRKVDYSHLIKWKFMFFNFVRSLLGVFSIWLCTYSVIHMKLIEVTVLLWTIPLFELIFSWLFLKDKATSHQIDSTLTCFLCIVAFSINLSEFSVKHYGLSLLPLLAAMLFALQDILIKKIGNDKRNDVSMLFLFSAVSASCSFPLIFYHDTFSLSVQNVLYLSMLGVCSQLMQYFLFISFRETSLTSLASVRYLEFAIQLLCGFVFFSEIPSVSSMGCAMIILFTVFFLNRVRSTKNVDRKRFKSRSACKEKGRKLRYTDEKQIYKTHIFQRANLDNY